MRRARFILALLAAFLLRPQAALGCASCFGQSDSPLAQGMNWGILAMLVVVVGMWVAFGSFFVYLARRAAKAPASPEPPGEVPPATTEITPS
jgi:threonine/homoserine/homoserine lactone efflux protein